MFFALINTIHQTRVKDFLFVEFLDDGKFHLHQRLNFSGFFFLFLDFSLRNFDFGSSVLLILPRSSVRCRLL